MGKQDKRYEHHDNAVCVTVYHPTGGIINEQARKEIEEAIWHLAKEHKLLVNVTLT